MKKGYTVLLDIEVVEALRKRDRFLNLSETIRVLLKKHLEDKQR